MAKSRRRRVSKPPLYTALAIELAELRDQLTRSEHVRRQMSSVIEQSRQDAILAHDELNQPHRMFRLIEYVGPRKWVEDTVARSIHGTHLVSRPGELRKAITAITISEYPDAMNVARDAESPTMRAGGTKASTQLPRRYAQVDDRVDVYAKAAGLEPETDDPFTREGDNIARNYTDHQK